MKISFRSKHEAAGGAGEEQEYAQIWERKVGTARRCLGKGTAADKLVLDCALKQVLGAGEREPEIPMEYEENEPQEEQEKMEILFYLFLALISSVSSRLLKVAIAFDFTNACQV